MKKIIFLLSFLLVVFVGYSQTALTSSANSSSLDTLTSATAHYLVSGKLSGFGATNVLSIYLKATEISGTTSGTATLEASQDGTNWYPYYNSKDSTYSFTLTDVSTDQFYRWELHNFSDLYYRIKVVGGGTVSVKISGKYVAKKD